MLPALFGCAAGSQKAAPLPPVSEVEERAPQGPPAEAPVAAPKPPTVVIIDENPAHAPDQPQTLAEAMRAEKERRAKVQKPVVVLDNKSLEAHGKDQKLTIAAGDPAAEASDAADASATAKRAEDAAAAARDEEYWRSRGLEIRERWRAASDRIDELQSEAESLRRRFYAADDPYLRDSQIKPEWDRVLAELDDSRREADSSASELERYLEDGRRAGALPGWLREGMELEPESRPMESPSAEPTEPVEADEPPGDPGR